MSDVTTEPAAGIGAVRKAIHRNVLGVHQVEVAFARERWRAAWFVAGAGVVVGVLGGLTALIAVANNAPQVRFTVIDNYLGRVIQAVSAEDAPAYFGEKVIRRALAEYVEQRERFTWQLDSEAFKRVTAMSAPSEQAAYAKARDENSPMTRYGKDGYARITRWLDFRQREKGKDRTFVYDVQFKLAELIHNRAAVVETIKTARIVFQFHPEFPQADQDAYRNETGLMVLSYHSTED